MSPIPVNLHPAGTLPLTSLYQIVEKGAASVTLWFQPLNGGKVLPRGQDLRSTRRSWNGCEKEEKDRVVSFVSIVCTLYIFALLFCDFMVALTEGVSGHHSF